MQRTPPAAKTLATSRRTARQAAGRRDRPGRGRSSARNCRRRSRPCRSGTDAEALHTHSAGGAYVNFMMDEGQERVQATCREHYDRLAQIKRTYAPADLFRVNQNIRPAER